jgi:hypothetical protein
MSSTPRGLAWVVCRDETRPVVRRSVACPLRGATAGIVCLGCRYLVTSSLERSQAGWCEADPIDLPGGERAAYISAMRRGAMCGP